MPEDSKMDLGYATKALLSCLLFMACSASMMIVNKQVTIAFGMPVTIVLVQMAFTVTVLVTIFWWTLHIGSCDDFVRWARLIPLLYAFMLTSSLLALDAYSMGAMTVVRNLAPIVTMPIEKAFQEDVPADFWTFVILFYILGGAFLYIKDDIHFSGFGLAMMIVNMLVASLERLMQRRLIAVKPVDISKMGMLGINNAVGMIYVSGFLLPPFFPEWKEWPTVTVDKTYADWLLLFLSCVAGVAIGWSAINAQFYVSATTMLVITNLNKVLVIAYGILVLGETSTPQAIAGCTIALTGGLLYGQDRKRLAAKAKAEEEEAKAKGGAKAMI